MKRHWFFLFFFVSGFCSLVYEVVWLRLGMARFGVTTPMVSIVLSVFMAGLGLGSWAGGRLMRRSETRAATVPLRLYGALEFVIGLSGLAVPPLIDAGDALLRSAGGGLAWGSGFFYVASGAWITLALLPWCTAMGATFPFAMAAIRGAVKGESERSFSFLYLANLLGAVAGTLVPAMVLIELLGFKGTLHVATALNFLLAATVLLLSSRLSGEGVRPIERVPASTNPAPGLRAERGSLWLLLTTGLCSMAMEVVWTREFTVYLGTVVYAFAGILALYLIANYAGSLVYRMWAQAHDPKTARTVWLLLGLAALVPLRAADPRFRIPGGVDPQFGPVFLWGMLRTAIGIVPFSALVGFATPMLVDRVSRGNPDLAGRAYAVNVVGSILGPIVAGFALLPWLGEHASLCVLAAPLLLAGLITALRAPRDARTVFRVAPRPLYGAAAVACVPLVALTGGYQTLLPQRVELRDYTATVIATGTGMGKRLLTNGTGMTKLTTITKMMAHLPLSMLPRPASSGLVICFGMGTTFRSMLSWNIHATAVELVPSVPKLFGYFHPDGPSLLALPRARVVIDDGRRFLQRSAEQFDVITLDPPPPVPAATSSLLYSREFYAVIKRHLRSGGIAQIWFPGFDIETQAAVTRALVDSFPYVRAFDSIEDWGTHYLASMQPLPAVDARRLPQPLPPAAVRDLLEWEPGSTAEQVMAEVLENEQSIPGFLKAAPGVPAMQDDRPINEYFLVRHARAPAEEE